MSIKSNSETRLLALADSLRACLSVDAYNVYTIGKILTDAHRIVEHGHWGPWIEAFGISEKSSRNYMAAHKFKLAAQQMPVFKSVKFTDLKLRASAIYMLAEMLEPTSPAKAIRLADETLIVVTVEDIATVLVAAMETWVGPKRLEAILRERHPVVPDEEPEIESTGDEKPAIEVAADEKPEIKTEEKPRPAVNAADEALSSFTAIACELWKHVKGRKPERFAKTGIDAESLTKLGKFLSALADLKKPAITLPGGEALRLDGLGETAKAQIAAELKTAA
jgi:hypothetical protein